MHNLMTVKETAEYLRIPLPTVYYLVQRGQLPAIQIGGRWRVKKDALDRDVLREEEQGQPTVLVVDDEEPIQAMFKLFLKKAGYSRLVVGTGKEALAAYAIDFDTRQAVVFTDAIGHVHEIEVPHRIQERLPQPSRIEAEPRGLARDVIHRIGETMHVDATNAFKTPRRSLMLVDLIRRVDRDLEASLHQRDIEVVAEPDAAAVSPRRRVPRNDAQNSIRHEQPLP